MRLRFPKSVFRYSMLLTLIFIAWQVKGFAQDMIVPAGTLIHCTLDEPNFSSATASVGDPVVCHLTTLQEFGRTVFPRGSYLAGHLEADKEPGHFVGKGYLRLVFDRVGFPNTDVPMPSKVIAARGFRVDREGDIVGHGHAKRDVAEWLFPPLWPLKVILLPARGPRPTLKGEEQLTLRLMEDIAVPRISLGPNWRFFGEQPGASSWNPAPAQARPVQPDQALPAQVVAATSSSILSDQQPKHTTVIALKSEGIYEVTRYRVDSGQLNYILESGQSGAVPIADVDWMRTSQLNEARNSSAALRNDARNFN